ncbi:S8 family peptidase [Teredinibacter turnerae]|uniref:S8 family peptidase n=1 Tax=Teredinibacter turnerae TaxID=2426 RepID=UPI00035C8677|nr:S8 family peptidase [Teredinibacter turnerae]
MDLRPHLSFLPPAPPSSTLDRLSGGGGPLNTPSPSAQVKRFKNQFGDLQKQFAEHITLCESVEGMSPEKILVLELAGSVKDFANALQKVEGFEYLNRMLTDEIVEENLVFSENKGKRKPVEREIYLTMSNQDGLNRLLTEWNKISKTGSVTRGLTPLRNALQQLHNIRFWDTEDRLKKTGLLEDWEYRIADTTKYGTELIPFEIELWFKQSSFARNTAEKELKRLIVTHGGSISASFIHTGIAYHGLRGELPIEQVRTVVENGAKHLQIMRSDEVMYFRPLGQCGFDLPEDDTDTINEAVSVQSTSTHTASDAVVALFDGLPLENHEALQNRIIVEDPDGFSDHYLSPSEQLHGTSMASLIVHGDKNAEESPLNSPLYVRPILAPGQENQHGRRMECIPEGVLPLDLIHRAVKRLFDGEGDEPPSAPNVKAINLSVCDPRQLFDRNMSPWARMLDWLSNRYKVLFVVSAGNHSEDIDIGVTDEEFAALNSEEREAAIIKSLNQQRWSRRMMSPAEAVNAVTVKAAHHDNAISPEVGGIIDPFSTAGMFSPVNPITLGKGNGVKPEIMVSGGRVTYRNTAFLDSDPVSLSVVNTPKPFGPGHKVAVPGAVAGAINSYAFSYGTSNAAALTTRRLALLHETIKSMKEFQADDALDKASESLILKALIVHGAELPAGATEVLESTLVNKENSRTFKKERGQFFGYGQVQEQRIHACKSNQATLIRTGELSLDESEVYSFPLPPCLASSEERRRMIVTLAWFSPINPIHNEYLQSQMWVSDPKKVSPLSFDNGDYYYHHMKKGTVYHDVIHGEKASPYLDGDEILLRVNCKARASGKNLKIPYALVVTLDTGNLELPIYEEIKQALEDKIKQTVEFEV